MGHYAIANPQQDIHQRLVMDTRAGRSIRVRQEHRSVGNAVLTEEVGRGSDAFLRAPRGDDPMWVVACGHCALLNWGTFRERRPMVVAEDLNEIDALRSFKLHVASHQLAAGEFRKRQRRAYRTQQRIESALAS